MKKHLKAKLDFGQIVDEVIQHFTTRPDADVRIKIEIETSDGKGFDEKLQRAVRENCNTLGFISAEFEDE